MTPAEFLTAIWPSTGVYAIATPFTIPNTDTRTYVHKTFDSIQAAAQFVEKAKTQMDIFFAVHSLKEPKVWNPQKINYKTGELGAYETRVQTNMHSARAFFFDLDVGTSTKKVQKYASQADALAGLIRFVDATELPRPMITSSGGGLHVYWLLETAMVSGEWKQYASKLRQLAQHHGLLADPARTTDTASVLRVAGTYNLKDPDNPRLVKVLRPSKPSSTSHFLHQLNSAIIRAGITPKVLPDFAAISAANALLGSNMQEEFTGPPVTIRALVTACSQVRQLVMAQGDVSEPEWYHLLNLVRFCENGDKLVHKVSEGHASYDPHATERKVQQLRDKGIKPTSCQKLAEVCGDHACEGCAFAGRVKSPIVAAKFKDTAPAPKIVETLGSVQVTTTVPDAPHPYTRLKGGGITKTTTNAEGDEIHIPIYEHDLYPIRRIVNAQSQLEQQSWRVVLPRQGEKDFVLDADALYDRRKFVTAISNHGIYPKSSNLQDLQDYMIAYIAELQRLSDAEAQCNHLGWSDDQTSFIMPDKIVQQDGSIRPAQLSLGAQRATAQVCKKGTLQRQVELMEFYNHPFYVPNQFFILCGLAAPIFYMTGHHGVIVNVSGAAGASKSTSLYTASAFWGNPVLYPINGTNSGATTRGRNERVTTLANLPICVDEITHIPVKDAIDLAMGITQPGHRIRLDTNGMERSSNGGYKATIMLTSANNSLHGLLSSDNAAGTAGSMRVVELALKAGTIHKKYEADEYMAELRNNYGHIGEQFIGYVVTHREEIEARVREVMREIDQEANIQSSERFWSATAAVVLVAAEIAVKLGLLPYAPAALRDWILTKQLPFMRGVVVSEYSTPLGVLADYLEVINGEILVVNRLTGNQMEFVTKQPRGQLLAHYSIYDKTMWVLKKAFKDYCVRIGAPYSSILDELSAPRIVADGTTSRIVTNKNVKKVLGSGTDYAKAQSWCFVINMADPEVTGAVELRVEVNPSAATTPATGQLKLV